MSGLFFAFMFGLMGVSWNFGAGRIRWDMLGPAVIVVVGVLAYVLSRKTVQIDDECLYASVFRRVVAIPLDQIAEVTEEFGLNANSRTVTVHFREETPMGRSIAFSPTFMLTREPHPIVEELRAHARVAPAV